MPDPIPQVEAALDDIAQGLASAGFQTLPPGEFLAREASSGRAPPVRPTPLPKRPKGRLFVGAILVLTCVVAGYQGINAFLRYSAYGIVTGRVIEISAPFDGAVRYIHVEEGETVKQEQLLLTLENLDLEHRLEQAQDELRIAQATLTAEMSKVRWNFDEHFDRSRKAAADYYQTWGELLKEQAKLDELSLDLSRAKRLKEQKVITAERFDKALYAEKGQREKVKKLQIALAELKTRWEVQERSEDDGYGQIQPTLVRIEMLQGELVRLRESLDREEIRAPVNGLVVKRYCFAGERVEAQQPIFSILEEGSLNIVMYLPQRSSNLLPPGSDTEVVVEPNSVLVTCRVLRLGERYEPVPENIARYYRKDERMLPVYLQPNVDLLHSLALRIGGVVKLPRFWLADPTRGDQ